MRWLMGIVIACLAGMQAAQAAVPVAVYGRLPGVELMRLSPSGNRYAFVGVIGESRRLGALSVAGEALYAVGVGEAKVRDLQWADDDHLLVTVSSTFKEPLSFRQAYELSTVLIIDLRSRRSSTVFEKAQGIANAVFGYYGTATIEGHVYGYFGGITYGRERSGDYYFAHGYPDLYRVDLDTGKPSLVDRAAQDFNFEWLVDRQGRVTAHSEYDVESGVWRLYEGQDRARLLLQKNAPLDNVELMGAGSAAGTVLVGDGSGGRDVIEELSITDARSRHLFDELTVNFAVVDPVTRELIGVDTQDDPGAYFLDPRLQARFNGTRKAFPGFQMQLASFSSGLGRLIVKTDGGDDSGTFWLVDIASGDAKPIASAYPLIKTADVGETHWIKYNAADGQEISAVLTLPPRRLPKKLPLVVLPHGGPIGVRDRLGFDWWAQAYASAGYAVLQPNYRGSSGYGRAFVDAGYGQWGRKMQTDLSDGVVSLAGQGLVDARRVCIVGGSYGGYAALAGVTLQHGVYRCAVSVAGPSDMSRFFSWQVTRHGYRSDFTRYWRQVTGAGYGDPRLDGISPARFAAQADAPVLLIHGEDDTVVPIEQSRIMEAALRSAQKPVELLSMKSEDHWLSREQTRVRMLEAAVEFVQRNNPAQ